MFIESITNQAIWLEQINSTISINMNRLWKKEFSWKVEKLLKITILAIAYMAFYVTFFGKYVSNKSVTFLCRKDPLIKDLGNSYLYYKSLQLHSRGQFEKMNQKKYPNPYLAWFIDSIPWQHYHPVIPKQFLDDSLLRINCCRITHQPIRYPVYEETIDDKGNSQRIYYERFAITVWLNYSDYSPFTFKKLKIEDLKRDEKLERQISDILEELVKGEISE